MKEMTLQLFEYLLAARDSVDPVNPNSNNDDAYWYLDEIIQLGNVRIVEEDDHVSYIEVSYPNTNSTNKKPEASLLLTGVFRILGSESPSITPEQLKAILVNECQLLKTRLVAAGQELIDLSKWQQLLLNVSADQLPASMIAQKEACCSLVIDDLLSEYQRWINGAVSQNEEQASELYGYLESLASSASAPGTLALGVGILRLPTALMTYRPLLTMEVDAVMDPYREICRLSIKDKSLKIDEGFLSQVLLHDPNGGLYLKSEVNHKFITLFDNDAVGEVLKKIITMIHPEGQYIVSPQDVENSQDHLPAIFHRSVLFTQEVETDQATSELKGAIAYLEGNEAPSDIVRSIVDSEHRPDASASAEWLNRAQTVYPLSSDGAEEMILNALASSFGVVVRETCCDSKNNAIANLTTHLASLGKKTLIIGQDQDEWLKIQNELPHYLKEAQADWVTQTGGQAIFSREMHQLMDEIASIEEKARGLQAQLVRHRELSSNEILWQDKSYLPYELSQFLAKLGEPGYVIPDHIPMEANLDASRVDLQKMWDFRGSFTPENLALLNYEFINVADVLKDEEYRKLLMAEKRYLALGAEFEEIGGLFSEDSDFGFVQYLHDRLPCLIQSLSGVSDEYEYRVLVDAMSSLGRYHQLTRFLDQFNQQIDRLVSFQGSEVEFRALLSETDQAFAIDSSMRPADLSQKNLILEFYMKKQLLMSQALKKAHSIWLFNEEARTLSSNFKGISAANLSTIDQLHHGTLLHLAKVELDAGWAYVSEYLADKHQSVPYLSDLHPSCLTWYEALQKQDFDGFKVALENVKELTTTRENFVDFANLSTELSQVVPSFVTTLMSEESAGNDMPDYHTAFNYAQLSTFFEKLHEQRICDLEDHLLTLRLQKQELVDQLIRKRCRVNTKYLDDGSIDSAVCFVSVKELPHLKIDPQSYDVAILTDASRQSVFNLSRLMFASRAVLFGRTTDTVTDYVRLDNVQSQEMFERHGPSLHRFGGQYLSDSLFDLVHHSIPWHARMELPDRLNPEWIEDLNLADATGLKHYDNPVEEEIFEALFKMGYNMRSKVEIGPTTLDMVVVGSSGRAAINVVGDCPMDQEVIVGRIEEELALRELGLNIYNLSATEFYLNSRQVLKEVSEYLARLGIEPSA